MEVGKRVEVIVLAGKKFVRGEYRHERLMLGPKDFDVLLALNTENRRLDRRWIDELYRRHSGGLWVFNGDPIVVSDEMVILNGQHRLHAYRRLGVPVECLVLSGIPSEAWSTYDGARRRTFGQELARHNVKYSDKVSTLTRAIWQYAIETLQGGRTPYITTAEIDDMRAKVGGIEEAARVTFGTKSLGKGLGSGTQLSFLIWAGQRILPQDSLGEMLGVLDGSLPANRSHVIFLLRDKLKDFKAKSHKAKADSVEVFALCIKALNHFQAGTCPRVLKWASGYNEVFPSIKGLPPEYLRDVMGL